MRRPTPEPTERVEQAGEARHRGDGVRGSRPRTRDRDHVCHRAAPPRRPTVTGPERRFTAPSGFDAGSTQIIDTPPDPATEIIATAPASRWTPKPVAPQVIPPRGDAPKPPPKRRSWGWVIALLSGDRRTGGRRDPRHAAADPRRRRRRCRRRTWSARRSRTSTPRSRRATWRRCAASRAARPADSYIKYDDTQWTDTHARVAAAKQYPVVASIDQVVVNGDHAEANVTTFMAFARRPGRRAASIWSSATSSGRSARPPAS